MDASANPVCVYVGGYRRAWKIKPDPPPSRRTCAKEVSYQASSHGEPGTINNQWAAAVLSPRPHRYRDDKGGKISISPASPDLFLHWDFALRTSGAFLLFEGRFKSLRIPTILHGRSLYDATHQALNRDSVPSSGNSFPF